MSKHIEHRMIDGIEHKHCTRCKEWKPLIHFPGQRRAPDGLNYYCRPCTVLFAAASQRRARMRRVDMSKKHRRESIDSVMGVF